jgi:hypothetical protein
MEVKHRYVPCVRWKQGEYQALLRLSPDVREAIMPLIEVPEEGYDFETGAVPKSIDQHLKSFAKRVGDKWGRRPCFVDVKLIDPSKRMEDGTHPIDFVFDGLRLNRVPAVPTFALDQDTSVEGALARAALADGYGICLRISLEELADPLLQSRIGRVLALVASRAELSDLVIDLGAPNFQPLDGLAQLLERLIATLPFLNEWRSIALIGTAFPSSMAEVPPGLSKVERSEWALYRMLVTRLRGRDVRVPDFGDYVISHPTVVHLDMRFVKPAASLRYTTHDGWLIAKGKNVRDHKFEQYRALCGTVVNSGGFAGAGFSYGDAYIEACAFGTASTGSLTTWRTMGTSHHVTQVVQDVASLPYA